MGYNNSSQVLTVPGILFVSSSLWDSFIAFSIFTLLPPGNQAPIAFFYGWWGSGCQLSL